MQGAKECLNKLSTAVENTERLFNPQRKIMIHEKHTKSGITCGFGVIYGELVKWRHMLGSFQNEMEKNLKSISQ